MRIEGVTEGTGSSLHQRAYEHAIAFRSVAVRRDPPQETTPSYDGAAFSPALVADLKNSSGSSGSRTEAVYGTSQLTAGSVAATGPRRVARTDSDGDGWADNYDLPFDYFQILRRATFQKTPTPRTDDQVDRI
jgi:hypothetical protein